MPIPVIIFCQRFHKRYFYNSRKPQNSEEKSEQKYITVFRYSLLYTTERYVRGKVIETPKFLFSENDDNNKIR